MLFRKAILAVIATCWVVTASAQTAGAAPIAPESIPQPEGFDSCVPDDPVAAIEKRIAPSLGAEFLGCFHSSAPDEYAFVHRVIGGKFTSADVEALRSKVADQWKTFEPLSEEFRDKYIARLNAMISAAGASAGTLSAVKPVLVSMKSLDSKSYSVISIRSYIFNTENGEERAERVNADAIVLRGQQIIRLTMQRRLTEVADVDEVQMEIARWAKAME